MQARWQSHGSAGGYGGSKAYAFDDVSPDTLRNARSVYDSTELQSQVSNAGLQIKDLISNPSKHRILIGTLMPPIPPVPTFQ